MGGHGSTKALGYESDALVHRTLGTIAVRPKAQPGCIALAGAIRPWPREGPAVATLAGGSCPGGACVARRTRQGAAVLRAVEGSAAACMGQGCVPAQALATRLRQGEPRKAHPATAAVRAG